MKKSPLSSSTFTAAVEVPVDEDELDELPLLLHLPLDEEDPRFTKSFHPTDDLQSLLEFFNHYGYVVLHSVFNADECDQTRRAMFDILEQRSPGYHHDDVSTFHLLNSKGKYGLSMRNPSFHERLVCNRQHERLITALDHIIRNTLNHGRADVDPTCVPLSSAAVPLPPSSSSSTTSSSSSSSITPIPLDKLSDLDVIVSHDRFAVYRPTALVMHGSNNAGIDMSNLYGNDAVSNIDNRDVIKSGSSSSSTIGFGNDAHRKESSMSEEVKAVAAINSSTFSTGILYYATLISC